MRRREQVAYLGALGRNRWICISAAVYLALGDAPGKVFTDTPDIIRCAEANRIEDRMRRTLPIALACPLIILAVRATGHIALSR